MGQETLRRIGGTNSNEGLSPAAALVRRHDRDRFQTALFAPAARREALFALYAFNYEIARVRESVSEPMLGQIRLQWWREAIDAAYGEAAPRRHEVVQAVTAAIRSNGPSREHFDRLIDARERDLDPERPATLAALEDYAEASSSPLIFLALEVLQSATPAAQEAGRHIGIAYALTGMLRALPHMAQSGRLFLPADLAPGLDVQSVVARRGVTELRQAVATIAEAAAGHLVAARGRRGEIRASAWPALLPARIAGTALRRLKRAGFDPFAPAFARDDPLQPWRLAVAALSRRF